VGAFYKRTIGFEGLKMKMSDKDSAPITIFLLFFTEAEINKYYNI